MQPAGPIHLVSHVILSRSLPILELPPPCQRHLHPNHHELSKTRCRERSQTEQQGIRLPSCKERSHRNQKSLWKRCNVGKGTRIRERQMRRQKAESRKEGKRQLNLELSCSQLVWKWERSGNKSRWWKQWKAADYQRGRKYGREVRPDVKTVKDSGVSVYREGIWALMEEEVAKDWESIEQWNTGQEVQQKSWVPGGYRAEAGGLEKFHQAACLWAWGFPNRWVHFLC